MAEKQKQKEDFKRLYHRAFAAYGPRALWNKQEIENPTQADALVVARALRMEGNRAARKLAERIETACNVPV